MKPFGAVLLSYGLSGKVFHAPFLAANPAFRLLGAWERSKQLIKSDYPEARSYHSIDEFLEDSSVDLVVVNTPTYTHFEYARKALSAGKHVIVEKAFTTTVEEAVNLEALATRSGRILTVFQNRRWDGDFLAVKEMIKAGDIGEVVEAQLSFERFNPVLSPKAHREEPGPGAGNLMDLGPHLIDQAMVLFGLPHEIYADLRARRPGSKVDDYFELLLFYPALRVRLRSTYLASEPAPAFVLHGTKGSVVMPRLDPQEVQLREGMKPDNPAYGKPKGKETGTVTVVDQGHKEVNPLIPALGNYMGFYDQLSAALEGRGKVPVTGQEGINVMRVLEAAQKSARQGKKISV